MPNLSEPIMAKVAPKYATTAVYISGGICGHLWMPDAPAGKPFRADVRPVIDRFSDPRGVTFREVLLHMLMENGGDFQDATFTADTVLRIERRRVTAPGQYTVHVRERTIDQLADCADLVESEAYTGDFLGDE